MDTRTIGRRLLLVAALAVNRLGVDFVVGMFGSDIIVATGAGVRAVYGPEELGRVYIDRDRSARGIRLGKFLVSVTLQTRAVLDRFGRQQRGGRQHQHPKIDNPLHNQIPWPSPTRLINAPDVISSRK
jgi:hypothetical protein